MKALVHQLKNNSLSLWWKADIQLSKFKKKISFSDKLSNEMKVEKFRKKLFKLLHEVPVNENEQENWRDKVLSFIKGFESSITGHEESIIDFFMGKGYPKATEEFIHEVKGFDPTMNVYDIFQAIRNVWIMNSIQILFDMKVELTPSVFAYSMLYPYSDNYLDDTRISIEDKEVFNHKFRKWLYGEQAEPSSLNESHIYQLIQKIECEFSREKFPKVYESLLAIHAAQERSLMQQGINSIPYERDIIDITFEKGGTSVLADAYLIRGELTEKESDFIFKYGVLLQLIDDLQDVKENAKEVHMTMLSQLAYKYPLDKLIDKLFGFIKAVFDNKGIFPSNDAEKLMKILNDSCMIMLYEAISKNKKIFSRKYKKEIEEYSMLRFSYFKKLKRKYQKSFSPEDIINICSILAREKEAETA